MNRTMFISGIIIFAIAGFVFMAGYQGVQEMISKFAAYSSETYQLYKNMESIGSIAAVIGILIAFAGIFEKNNPE